MAPRRSRGAQSPREHARGAPGSAAAFLEAHEDARLCLPFIVAGELAAGTSLADRARWVIGGNDLWIAATALAYRMPVVTRNVEHYRRVPGLEVEAY